jgi:hypothetical protein
MTGTLKAGRRELGLFVLLAVLPALAISGLFLIHPWATPMRQQAAALGFDQTGAYLLAGALGVFLLPWSGAARTPALSEGRRWTQIGAWSLGLGVLSAVVDIALNRLTPWGAHLAAVDKRNGFDVTFINVHPPWSLLHYFHASIISECAFRFVPIFIPVWLIGRLARGRYEAATYWTFALLAACIEPLEKAVFLRRWALFGDTPMEQAMNAEAIAWQFLYAVLLRRFGWPAPILVRFGWYLVARCFHQ